jgi:hypothetical protein
MTKIEEFLIIFWPVEAIRSPRLNKIIASLTSGLHVPILSNGNAFLDKGPEVHHRVEIQHLQDNTTHLE